MKVFSFRIYKLKPKNDNAEQGSCSDVTKYDITVDEDPCLDNDNENIELKVLKLQEKLAKLKSLKSSNDIKLAKAKIKVDNIKGKW